MASSVSLPYLSTPGTLDKALPKLKEAAKPERFTGDFVDTVLQIKGGTGRAVSPFLKKIGFLNTDGTPTTLYERFRNPASSKHAMADAIRMGYKSLYQVNEYAHSLKDEDLKGAIVQVTGLDAKNNTVNLIFMTFKKLKTYASFDRKSESSAASTPGQTLPLPNIATTASMVSENGINLSYTINLNLPATTNIEVFNAIFRSLREHLLSR